MICPKCYGKINKNTNRCDYCGFDLKELDGASNKEAKKALRGICKDDVLYTANLPADVSKKKLLLLSIFLGLFGAHDFYVGKFWTGLFMCLTMVIITSLQIILTALGLITDNLLQTFYVIMTIPQGFVIIMWIASIFEIGFEKFKVPVYKESFSKKK